ncbi:thioredoxin family protein [Bacteroidota bacterium]
MIRKYIFIAILGSLSITGCSNTSEPKDNTVIAANEVVAASENARSGEKDGKAIHITKKDFLTKVMDYEANPQEWIYKGDKPCLIDFYADWCGPCKIASPILDELAGVYDGKIYVYKVDTEVERELSSVFGIRSIPAFLFCPEDGNPTMSNGIARTPEETKQMFIQMIDEILLGKGADESL